MQRARSDATPGWKVPALLVALTWAVFGRTLGHDFVNLDDNDYVYENPAVLGGLTWEGVRWAFTRVHSGNWHPLTWLSHMLDVELFGGWAGGHHATSVLLHGASSVLLYLAFLRMTGARWRSAFVAAAFALHPLRVESVAWVAERKDILCGLFFAMALLVHAPLGERPATRRRQAALALVLALGLQSKPMLVTLPLVLLVLDRWPLRRGLALRAALHEKLPLFALCGASAAITLSAQSEALVEVGSFPIGARLANACVSAAVYVLQLVWPLGLAVFHPLRADLPVGEVIAALAFLVVVSAAAWAQRGARPWALAGWSWYLLMLLPVAGIVQVGSQAHADRYTYLPHIGLYAAIAWGLGELAAARGRWVAAVGATWLAVLALLATLQVGHWRDSVSLWRSTLANTRENALANHSLAGALSTAGDLEGALSHYREAVRLKPDSSRAHTGLASTSKRLGRPEEALEHYRRALELAPGSTDAQNNLAWFLATVPVDALRDGGQALGLAESAALATAHADASVVDTLAAACAELGRFEEAVRWQERAVDLAPPAARGALRQRLDLYRARQPFRELQP